MKQSIFILGFSLMSVFSFAKSNIPVSENTNEKAAVVFSDQQTQSLEYIKTLNVNNTSDYQLVFKKNSKDYYDCEVTVKADIEGNQVDLVVTIYDVSWVGCQGLKAAVKLALATV